jgi:chorismate mutase/prephenate dehydratase
VLDRVAALSEGDFRSGASRRSSARSSRPPSRSRRSSRSPTSDPEATFTHEAALRSFGTSVELEPQTTVAEVFARVERGEVEHGVVPVENSMEGAVTHTLDEMMDSPLKICGEVYLPVSQNLISAEPSLDRLRVVCSHPMALAQAAGWLRRELPASGWRRSSPPPRRPGGPPSSRAWPRSAAPLAAGAHGLEVLAANIQEARANTTRFIVLGRAWAARTGKDKTSVLFSVKDRPGVLKDALSASRRRGSTLPASRAARAASGPGPTFSSRTSRATPRRRE